MEIKYRSTRSDAEPVEASLAILRGLAPDGGLYVPCRVPDLDWDFQEMAHWDYRRTAFEVMRRFLTDFTEEELTACIDAAYDDKFDTPLISPLTLWPGAAYLELFHGATIAFKDMALSILPHLMVTSAKKQGITDKIAILTATSGDTGKAAMAGFCDVPGTEIIVFYPKDGVSPIQERQMVTQPGENTHVVAILGNFDDAQTAVKRMFGDEALNADLAAAGVRLSSANSINIGRLVPQIVYYVWAYLRMAEAGRIRPGEKINIAVPTGNFGNILAAWYAREMGLPVGKLICASNENKVLFDFFSTGVYDKNRPFVLTSSPSMDILVSSNLERLVFLADKGDAASCKARMDALSSGGRYEVTESMKETFACFAGGYATEEETRSEIRRVFVETGYVTDTHTAVAGAVLRKYRAQTGDETPTVIASTASPYKFPQAVLSAIAPERAEGDSMALTEALAQVSGIPVPNAVRALEDAVTRHDTVCKTADMESVVREILIETPDR